MIGIIGAIKEEVLGLFQKLEQPKMQKIGGTTFYSGRLACKDVVVALSGIGKVNASMTTSFMLATFPDIKAIINIGVAGGIARGMRQCDMILATKSVQHDVYPGEDMVPQGQVPGFDFLEFVSDEGLVKAAQKTLEQNGITYHKGLIATGDEFVRSDKKAQFLSSHFGAIGCDMETAAIAHVSYKMGIKFLSLRSVSDSGGDGADLSFYEFLQKAADISIQCASSLIANIDENTL